MKTLAEQVGEEVMGYTMKWVDGSDWNQEMPAGLRDDWGYATLIAEDDGLKFEWAPDENVNDWWELVEKMRSKGWSGLFAEGEIGPYAQFSNHIRTVGSDGDSIFEATCLAAMRVWRDE